jgi:hypothetical protein
MYYRPRIFRKTVAAAGTRERLTTSDLRVSAVVIQADPANTNNIYVGDNQVSSTNGFELDALDNIVLSAETLGQAGAFIAMREIWIDADTTAEGVSVLYLERVE